MKNYYFISLLLLSVLHVYGQPRKILYATASVRNMQGKLLKKGDVLNGTEPLKMGGPKDSAIVMVMGKGIGLLTAGPNAITGKRNAEWLAYFKDTFWMTPKDKVLQGRPGPMLNDDDLARHLQQLAGGKPLLIIDSLQIPVGGSVSQKADHGFYYLQYKTDAGTINKQLKFRKQSGVLSSLVIDTSLLKMDGKLVRPIFQTTAVLLVYEDRLQGSTPIATLDLCLMTKESLRVDLCEPDSTHNLNFSEVLQYLALRFGNGDEEQLRNTIKKFDCH